MYKTIFKHALLIATACAQQYQAYAFVEKNQYELALNAINPIMVEGVARAKYLKSTGADLSSTPHLILTEHNHPYLSLADIRSSGSAYYLVLKFAGTTLANPAGIPSDLNNGLARLADIPKSLHGKYIVFTINTAGIQVYTNQHEDFSRNTSNTDKLSDTESTTSTKVPAMFTLTDAKIPELLKEAIYKKMGGTTASPTFTLPS